MTVQEAVNCRLDAEKVLALAGLTDTELNIGIAIMHGCDLPDVAPLIGVSRSTVYRRYKHLLAKVQRTAETLHA